MEHDQSAYKWRKPIPPRIIKTVFENDSHSVITEILKSSKVIKNISTQLVILDSNWENLKSEAFVDFSNIL